MTDNDAKSVDIGMEYMKGIYTNTDIETRDAQPIFILQRDTVRTFLHEKIESFGLSSRLLGYLGIGLTLLAALVTTTFNDWLGLKGSVIEGVFITFFIIVVILILKDGITWCMIRKTMTVDVLSHDLGERGTIIKPNSKSTE